jgi:serine O-acetyltransferase
LADDRQTRHVAPLVKRDVEAFVDGLLGLLFPQLSEECDSNVEDIHARLVLLGHDLRVLLRGVMVNSPHINEAADTFVRSLPEIYRLTRLDADAIVAGDPAAETLDEVVAAYPGFLAIAIFRVAHVLYTLGVPILPRMLCEIAHARTGIDIHPGATIGHSFCIDHGTGVVVGESAVIGDHVKLYQGVTLGALSVSKRAAGTKRHPTIEDRVVVYANATVLGGDTVVGHDSVVGGNVWLVSSVPPFSFLYQQSGVTVRNVADALQPSDFVI